VLVEQIDRIAHSAPDRIAVVAAGAGTTYRELRSHSRRVAASLAGRGIGPGSLVGVLLPRTAAPIVAMVGVLRTGAAFALLEYDGADPVDVVRAKLADADAVLTTTERAAELGPLQADVLRLDAPLAGGEWPAQAPAPPDRAAYVVYTSGSTGPAKGVVVEHGNIRHYAESLLSRLAITEPLAYANVTTLSADLGNTCLFLPLWSGGTIHLVSDEDRRDPRRLAGYLRSANVDVLKTTPSHWAAVSALIRPGSRSRPALRYLLLGGEALLPQPARELLRSGVTEALVNHYGPSEATVGVAVHVMRDERDVTSGEHESVPIGLPLGDTRLVVRTADSAWREKAATGELYIGGPSVARGYLGATSPAFCTDDDQGRLYRTGDLVRLDDSGTATFLGRVDRQVKIGGYRIELEYVESVLRALPGIHDASCHRLAVGDRGLLAAAIVPESPDTSVAGLAQTLRGTLPWYMIPRRFVPFGGFPTTDNGKLDVTAIRRTLARALSGADLGTALPEAAAREAGTGTELFRKYLGRADFGPDDDFFELGGDSIDAIQVVGELQRRGHDITMGDFLAEPTVRTLSARQPGLVRPAELASPVTLTTSAGVGFASSQAWFLTQDFAEPDFFNQALCFDVSAAVDPAVLRACVADLVAFHPMLHTAYRVEDCQWVAALADPPADCFSQSVLAATAQIVPTARQLHAAIDISTGRVFRAHLFRRPGSRGKLLLICHHLSVDAVSWRILTADLAALYRDRAEGRPAGLRAEVSGFWDWLRSSGTAFVPAVPDRGATGQRAHGRPANTESSAHSAWMVFSEAETRRLARDLPAAAGVPLHAALLGAFVHAAAQLRDVEVVAVDVEAHGRRTDDAAMDISRTVGWFTATHRLNVRRGADPGATTRHAAVLLTSLADAKPAPTRVAGPVASFNFLGQFEFPRDEPLALSPAGDPIGPARGPGNDRIYDLRFTARVLDGRLAIDLSFSAALDTAAGMTALLDRMRQTLSGLTGGAPVDAAKTWVQPGSTSGLLTAVPSPPVRTAAPGRRRDYRTVLLTGATGYIGAHLLRSFLLGGDATVCCLVRAADEQAATARLWDTLSWYFPDENLRRHAHRVTVLAGDTGEPGFGLPPATYRWLAADLDAVYHLAADTRLVGRPQVTRRVNTDSVREAIRLCSTLRQKDLHFMSTLAVCGYLPGPDQVPFGEDDLDIGQRFLSEYEESKFRAELLIRRFAVEGGSAFVYRAGNVTGHSVTGRFQRNGGDNRLVQTLRALTKLGRAPDSPDGGGGSGEQIALSPVDTVADAVFALSTSAQTAPGTFHVDAGRGVAYQDVLRALRGLGFDLCPAGPATMADLIREHPDTGDPDLALAALWAGRRRRNVAYRNLRTHQQLGGLGVRFADLGPGWLERFLRHLMDEGILVRTRGQSRSTTSEGSSQ
jgi:amino acid adenylation domain-containing protein/thioester reductase-like protein